MLSLSWALIQGDVSFFWPILTNTVPAFTLQSADSGVGFLLSVADFPVMLYSPTGWEMKLRNWGCCVLKMSKAGRAGWLPFDSSRYLISFMEKELHLQFKLHSLFCSWEDTCMFLNIICLQNDAKIWSRRAKCLVDLSLLSLAQNWAQLLPYMN